MQAAAPPLLVNLHAVRNFLFLAAVLLMNYTMVRPSPVDIAFLGALAASALINQRVTGNFFVYFFVIGAWTLSFYVASISFVADEYVYFELIAKTFVVVLGFTACWVAMSWSEQNFIRFLKVYILATAIAAALGIAGFVLGVEELLWDGRSKALIDDPNMYGGFLIPGILASLYMLTHGGNRPVYLAALLLLLFGILFSFSRAATGSLAVTGSLYLLFVYRRNPVKAGLYFFLVLTVALVLGALAISLVDDFGAKVFDRLTVAKEYDSGHFGRYNRYLLAIPFILDNPLGMGIGQIDRYFPEPIHNIFISSFLNYGWVAGTAWVLMLVLAVRITWINFRATRNSLTVLLLCCFLSQILCAVLHECEHWRQLWLFMGLVYGFNARNFPAPAARVAPAAVAPAAAASGAASATAWPGRAGSMA